MMRPHKLNMNLSREAIQIMLGIKNPIPISLEEMSSNITVTFYPHPPKISPMLELFKKNLCGMFKKRRITVVPYTKTLIYSREKGDRIKKGVVIIAIGDSSIGNFPVDKIISFTENPILTVIEEPKGLETPSYTKQMDIGAKLLARYMSSAIIYISKGRWRIYTFNGFSPFYKLYENFDEDILNNVIPKIATRVRPPQLSEFKVKRLKYNFLRYPQYNLYIKDLVRSGPLFEQTKLFFPVKKIDSLSFRNKFYRYIASLFLDERSGMSYGFIARQLPVKLKKLIPFRKLKNNLNIRKQKNKDYFIKNNRIYILLEINKEIFAMKVPPVFAFISRSGSNKMKLNPLTDILKVGLVNGQMILEIPKKIDLRADYRPSFDVQVILSHFLANAVYGNVLYTLNENAMFPKFLMNKGLALAHWHGEEKLPFIPNGWHTHGENNPPVPCGCPQAAIYAFKGKEEAINRSLNFETEFLGDIHIESQHGINITWTSLKELGNYLLSKSASQNAHNKWWTF
jgi:hypothetical protein